MKALKDKILFFCFVFSLSFSWGQEFLEKGNFRVGGDFGISFYNRDIAHLSSQDVPGSVRMDDALRVHLQPKVYYG